MNSATAYLTAVRSASRARDHEKITHALNTLGAEYPYVTQNELYDVLIESQYDLETARGLINQATLNGQSVSAYLAALDAEGEEK